jgi:hypothetical protein
MMTTDLQPQLEALHMQDFDILVIKCPPGAVSTEIVRQNTDILAEHLRDHDAVCLVVPDGWSIETFNSEAAKALRAWHAAWLTQGEGRVLAMVEAHRKTCRALGMEENA